MQNIVHVDGEWYWRSDVSRAFPVNKIKFESLATEHEFRKYVDGMKTEPSAVILEKEFPYCSPSPDMPNVPEEVRSGGYANAGARSFRYLRQNRQNVPVIFLFCYDFINPPEEQIGCAGEHNVYFVDKGFNWKENLNQIIERISKKD